MWPTVAPAISRLGAAKIVNIIMKKSEEQLETGSEQYLERGRECGTRSMVTDEKEESKVMKKGQL